MKQILRLAGTLTIVCAVAAFGLGVTNAVTHEQIIEQQKKIEAEACQEALPVVKNTDDFKERKDLAKKVKEDHKGVLKVFEGEAKGKRAGWCVQVDSRGYGGPIIMAVGIDASGKVTGVKIITQNETPGLGTKIDEPAFKKQFKGKKSDDGLEVGKDVDAIAGATISSKALTNGIKEALEASGMF